MVPNKIGLCPEYIIHPGVTLREVLEERNISQSELAHRTGVTEAHISKILSGQKAISVILAQKLEYALGLDATFWVNLQSQYECELSQYEEANGVSEDEIKLLQTLKDIISYAQRLEILPKATNKASQVLDLRRVFRISNLCDIPGLATSGAFRIKQVDTVNSYVLFAWIRLCEILTSKNKVDIQFDKNKLEQSIDQIKKAMFVPAEKIQTVLQSLFADCGISFCIVRHFKGAPIQGYIKKNNDGTLMLAITIRHAYADIFWFTLFHEIGHIINDDIGRGNFIDYTGDNAVEKAADKFASEILIQTSKYKAFIKQEDYSLGAIEHFAQDNNIPIYIVIGRLQKEKLLPYNLFSYLKLRYVWAE